MSQYDIMHFLGLTLNYKLIRSLSVAWYVHWLDVKHTSFS